LEGGNGAAASTNESELQSEIDMLGTLDIDQIDNILSIADNMAVKLAYQTSEKMKNLVPGKKISEEREKLRK
jgi:hypothetical protein